MNLRACSKLAIRPHTGIWYRALRLKHWTTRLSTTHSVHSTSRFSGASGSRPGYRILYLGETHQVALYEVRALYGSVQSPVPDPKGSWAVLALDVQLDHIVDLSDHAELKLIRTTSQELTGAWTNYVPGEAPTQKLGQSLHQLPSVEGFFCPSSVVNSKNLVIFPDKLGSRSSITFFNEISSTREVLT